MRLIDADALLEAMKKADKAYPELSTYWSRGSISRTIKLLPTVDAVQVVHGHDTGHCRIFHCSECGYGVNDIYQEDEHNYPVGEFNYCPNCGAKMDGKENEDA